MEPETIDDLKALGPLTPAEVDEHRDWDFAFNVDKWRLINTIDVLRALLAEMVSDLSVLFEYVPGPGGFEEEDEAAVQRLLQRCRDAGEDPWRSRNVGGRTDDGD